MTNPMFEGDISPEYRAALQEQIRMSGEMNLGQNHRTLALFLMQVLSDDDIASFIEAVASRAMEEE